MKLWKKGMPGPAVLTAFVLLAVLGLSCSRAPSDMRAGPHIADQAGRTVALPEKVERVVCLWPETTRLLYAIGAKDLLVGIDNGVCNGPVLPKVWPGLRRVPVVGTMSSVNMEELVAKRPDLVILSARSKRLAEQIAKHNLPVVCFHTRGKWRGFLEEITLLGRCVQREKEAAALRGFLEEEMAEVDMVVCPIPEERRPRVYVTFAYDPLRTTPLDAVQLAGGINLASGNRDIWYTVDMEWLLARDPDIIVQHALGKYDLSTMGGGWSSLRAVKEGKIYRVYLGYCGVDPAAYVVEVRQMAALFHRLHTPWAKGLAVDARSIYRRVYGRSDVFDVIAGEMNLTLARPAPVNVKGRKE